MSDSGVTPAHAWSTAWLDAGAFAAGLAMAWWWQWQTRDLVWSLWLSSLCVGYAMIVWMIFGPLLTAAGRAWRNSAAVPAKNARPWASGVALYLAGGLFLLAFFTVHFGMFHFVHSVFLNAFFPVLPGRSPGPSLALYAQVFRSYWPFVILAAVAERQAFRLTRHETPLPDLAVTPDAIAARKLKNARGGLNGMMTPYKNVIRLHLLIFFFAFASFTHWDNFPVYAVVYAVYFFPWRMIRRARE